MAIGRTIKDLRDRAKALQGERANWESWWQSLAKYCLPRKAEITEKKSSGTEFDADVYDSTAVESANIFSAGLMGYMTNPAQPWFQLRAREEAVQEAEGVREFFDQAAEVIHRTFHGSNFYDQLHEFYLEYGVFGTSGFYSEEDALDVVRYYARPIRELCFDEDERGRLQTVYRTFELTAQQAHGRWGDAAGPSVAKLMKGKQDEQKLEFVQCVGPRGFYNPAKRDKINKPVYSIWIAVQDARKIAEGGFEEQPFHIARASKVAAEQHGYSPAMHVLLDFNPAAVNYRLNKVGAGSDEQVQFLDHKGNIPVGEERLLATQQTIKRGFFTDLFLLLADRDKTMTAYEVSELMGERMLILGPLLGRLQNELLEPVIVRTFNILARLGRRGKIPPGPAGRGEYQVEYVSVLARAQQMSQVKGITNFLLITGEMAKLDPQVLDEVNADEALDRIAELSGVRPRMLHSDQVVAQKRAERKQAQEAAAKLQMAQLVADAAKTGGEAAREIGAATGGGEQA